MVLPWSQVVSAQVCISYCPDDYLRRTLCTCLQLRTVPASPAFLPARGCALASRCCRLTSFVSRLLGHCLPLLEVQCLETHRFIDCGVIFVVSGGRGNLVPEVPFWPKWKSAALCSRPRDCHKRLVWFSHFLFQNSL